MRTLYVTADEVGTPTGGGVVTKHEDQALCDISSDHSTLSRDELLSWKKEVDIGAEEPWAWDHRAVRYLSNHPEYQPHLAHFYAGTFGATVAELKARGTKVAYTIAAHDRALSKQAHEELGLPFPYPHLVEEPLWQKYIEGYRLADVIVCPSSVAAATVRAYGEDFNNKRIEVIPHGCAIPDILAPYPNKFVVGYLGSFGADKGVRYLLEAWKSLNYPDAELVLAGRDSTGPMAKYLLERYGGGNVKCMGWVDRVETFYNALSLYVQPSVTEGFGIEVIEAMAHGRPVLCSLTAGAQDAAMQAFRFKATDVGELRTKIDIVRSMCERRKDGIVTVGNNDWREVWRRRAEPYAWNKVRRQYQALWKGLADVHG